MAGYSISLHGKTALVTGASSGLGQHFARVLANAGAKVALAARRLDRLQQVEAEIRAEGGQAFAVALDVTDRASVTKAFDAAEAALGPVTILVNNAGVPSGSYLHQDQRGGMALACWPSTSTACSASARKQRGAWRRAAHRRLDHQHRLALGFGVIKALVDLLRLQGGGGQPHQIDGAGAGARQDPRQRAGARLFRHRVQRRASSPARPASA